MKFDYEDVCEFCHISMLPVFMDVFVIDNDSPKMIFTYFLVAEKDHVKDYLEYTDQLSERDKMYLSIWMWVPQTTLEEFKENILTRLKIDDRWVPGRVGLR